MNYTIENDLIKVSINSFGAELSSFIMKENGREYLWQGDANIWNDRAPNLFPVCGRLVDLKYTYEGKTYNLGLHGFAYRSEFSAKNIKPDSIDFELTESDENLKAYPFKFKLTIHYELKDKTLIENMTVENTGDKVLPCNMGVHPGFNVPFDGENFEDCYVEFGEECKPEIIRGFNSGNPFVAYPLKDNKTLPLYHKLFDNDGEFLRNASKTVSLKSHRSDKSVTLKYDDMKYVGIWHAPFTEANYVCLEAWYAIPASNGKVPDIMTDLDMIFVDPGDKKTLSVSATIE